MNAEIQIKKAVKAGNSSAVILPRAWLNQEVRIELVEKTPELILIDVLNIAKTHIPLKEIIGIYLTGSYARHEEDKNSDIDILIITKDIDKKVIQEGIYSILIVSERLLKQKLEKDLFPIGQMIRESKALLNSNYLNSIKIKVTKNNIKWYLKTTEQKRILIKQALEKIKVSKADNRIIYTLVLRIRTIYIIQKLIKNQEYSKREFQKLIEKVSGSKSAYNSYLSVKSDLAEVNKTSKEEAENLYNYLKKQLEELKKITS